MFAIQSIQRLEPNDAIREIGRNSKVPQQRHTDIHVGGAGLRIDRGGNLIETTAREFDRSLVNPENC
jgi:hypothetical protein